jgi:hypothetical protein
MVVVLVNVALTILRPYPHEDTPTIASHVTGR